MTLGCSTQCEYLNIHGYCDTALQYYWKICYENVLHAHEFYLYASTVTETLTLTFRSSSGVITLSVHLSIL